MKNAADELIDFIAMLPGLGPRSAKRIFFSIMRDRKRMMYRFAELLKSAADNILDCDRCGSFDVCNPCAICTSPERDATKLCIVNEIGDLWSVENSSHYNGLYYCLMGVMSTDKNSYQKINPDKLICKIESSDIKEIIVATNATIESQTTAYFLIDIIKEFSLASGRQIVVTALGQGMPMGSELDYLDEGTIGAAFRSRKEV